jgi:hypothetical protein
VVAAGAVDIRKDSKFMKKARNSTLIVASDAEKNNAVAMSILQDVIRRTNRVAIDAHS